MFGFSEMGVLVALKALDFMNQLKTSNNKMKVAIVTV